MDICACAAIGFPSLRMRYIPNLVILALFMLPGALSAQGGMRLIFWDVEKVGEARWAAVYGLGYDQDLNTRLSLAAQFRYGTDGTASHLQFDYRTAYHLADNGSSSFYLGPQIGVRSYQSGVEGTVVPLGMRVGVRGGLQGFYADLHAGFFVPLGADGLTQPRLAEERYELAPVAVSIGLHMGIGWAGRKN